MAALDRDLGRDQPRPADPAGDDRSERGTNGSRSSACSRTANGTASSACPDPHTAAVRLTALRDGLAIDRTLFEEHPTNAALVEQMRWSIRLNIGLSAEQYAGAVGLTQVHAPSAAPTESLRRGDPVATVGTVAG